MGAPESFNSRHLSLFTQPLLHLGIYQMKGKSTKELFCTSEMPLITLTWSSKDVSSRNISPAGNCCTGTCWLQWGIQVHNASKGAPVSLEPFLSAQKFGCCTRTALSLSFSAGVHLKQQWRETTCSRFTKEMLLVSPGELLTLITSTEVLVPDTACLHVQKDSVH